jgi:hypothetical protein
VLAQLSIEAGLAPHAFARPLSYAPDVWVGITDRLTVGVIHSSQSVDQIAAGATFCVRELATRCDRSYRGSGLDLRWAWRDAIVWRLRALVRDVDPVKPAVTAGALLRWTHGRSSITGDPYLRFGLANRDAGNRDTLVAPVWLARRVGEHGSLALHTGLEGDLAAWRDGWHVPFAVVAELAPVAALAVGVEAGFPSLLGPQNSVKTGALIVYASWHGR